MNTYYVIYMAKIRNGTVGKSLEVKADSKYEAKRAVLANPPKDFLRILGISKF